MSYEQLSDIQELTCSLSMREEASLTPHRSLLTTAYIALGSNLENPREQVAKAIKEISKLSAVKLLKISSIYETPPLGPQNQPDFINQVICVEMTLTAFELLDELLAIENKMGRVRTVRWGPRIIDCDILLFGDEVINTERLVIPHPEMHHRDFVLKPLAELGRTK